MNRLFWIVNFFVGSVLCSTNSQAQRVEEYLYETVTYSKVEHYPGDTVYIPQDLKRFDKNGHVILDAKVDLYSRSQAYYNSLTNRIPSKDSLKLREGIRYINEYDSAGRLIYSTRCSLDTHNTFVYNLDSASCKALPGNVRYSYYIDPDDRNISVRVTTSSPNNYIDTLRDIVTYYNDSNGRMYLRRTLEDCLVNTQVPKTTNIGVVECSESDWGSYIVSDFYLHNDDKLTITQRSWFPSGITGMRFISVVKNNQAGLKEFEIVYAISEEYYLNGLSLQEIIDTLPKLRDLKYNLLPELVGLDALKKMGYYPFSKILQASVYLYDNKGNVKEMQYSIQGPRMGIFLKENLSRIISETDPHKLLPKDRKRVIYVNTYKRVLLPSYIPPYYRLW